mmetsp:Transcript_44638/g.95244  ORF Transcript_44638/g.95244 Transcript_44638/m.95244 type:complete len:245 (+) Transcript_44638:211-945(+)
MLLFTLLCRLSNSFVQVLDSLFQASNGFLGFLDLIVQVADLLVKTFLGVLQILHLILSLVELLVAVLFLRVIILLLLVESVLHLIDHLDDLVEAHLLALKSERNEVQMHAAAPLGHNTESLQRFLHQFRGSTLNLQQAGNGFLEKLQSVIVVQNFDGVRDSEHLLRTSFLGLSVIPDFVLAILLQLQAVSRISLQLLLGVGLIILQLNNRNSQLSGLLRLLLDGVSRSLNGLVLCCDQLVEVRN